MMQNPRFPEEFYNRYYDEFYPYMRARSQSNVEGDLNNVGGKKQMDEDGTPNDFGFEVAVERAKNLYEFIDKEYKNTKKKFIGCWMRLWRFFLNFLQVKVLKLLVMIQILRQQTCINRGLKIDLLAGKMAYNKKFGLIIIIGSLEHCFNPNIVLKKCWEMLEDEGIIVIEGGIILYLKVLDG